MRRPISGLLAAGALLLAVPAQGGAMVRAARRGPAIASAVWVCDAGGIDFAPDGVHFREVDLPTDPPEPTDMAVLDDGTLLVATQANLVPESSSLSVWRRAPDARRWTRRELAFVPFAYDARFRVRDSGVEFVTEHATYLSTDGGKTFARSKRGGGVAAEWHAGDPPRYSPDRGGYYQAVETANGCALELHARGTTAIVDRTSERPCTIHGVDNGRFTIVLFGKRLLRVRGQTAQLVGVVKDLPTDLTPDANGGAILIDDEGGKLTRYTRGAAPEWLRGGAATE